MMFIYITVYEDFAVYNSYCFKIVNEYKIMKINFLKFHSHSLVICYNENLYSSLLKCICFINNLLILYIFYNLYFNIMINVKYIEKINNFRKYLKNCVYKSKLTVNNYEI